MTHSASGASPPGARVDPLPLSWQTWILSRHRNRLWNARVRECEKHAAEQFSENLQLLHNFTSYALSSKSPKMSHFSFFQTGSRFRIEQNHSFVFMKEESETKYKWFHGTHNKSLDYCNIGIIWSLGGVRWSQGHLTLSRWDMRVHKLLWLRWRWQDPLRAGWRDNDRSYAVNIIS